MATVLYLQEHEDGGGMRQTVTSERSESSSFDVIILGNCNSQEGVVEIGRIRSGLLHESIELFAAGHCAKSAPDEISGFRFFCGCPQFLPFKNTNVVNGRMEVLGVSSTIELPDF